jgi:sigma-54 dependent transcriptional regulator, acetoin dehydrogenase operon transcriptional activator AcoR
MLTEVQMEIATHAVRPVIAESWQRCHRAGIDPDQGPESIAQTGRYLMLPRHQELIEASELVVSQAEQILAGCGTVMILTDERGVVLRISGDHAALGAAASIGLITGTTWTECVRGTNAIGLALRVGEPVHVHGSDHYCAALRRWTSSADVVRDPVDAAILGAISVAGPREAFDPHLLPLVVASAARIRAAWSQHEILRREQLLEYALGVLSRKAAAGLILFDRRGRLVTLDARARLALSALGLGDESELCARVQALDVRDGQDTSAKGLPHWLRADWIEAVIVAGKRIGSIVRLPSGIQLRSTSEGGLPRYKIRRVTEFIHARIEGPINLDDLAQVAGVSRSHFHRQFKKSLGMTPHDFVLQTRVERAKELLLDSDDAVANVAARVGFTDQSHFSSAFRRQTSMTPLTFRNAVAR